MTPKPAQEKIHEQSLAESRHTLPRMDSLSSWWGFRWRGKARKLPNILTFIIQTIFKSYPIQVHTTKRGTVDKASYSHSVMSLVGVEIHA